MYVSERDRRGGICISSTSMAMKKGIAPFFCNYWVTLELRGNMAVFLAANCQPFAIVLLMFKVSFCFNVNQLVSI